MIERDEVLIWMRRQLGADMNINPGRYAIRTRDEHGRETLSLVEVVQLLDSSLDSTLRWRYLDGSDLMAIETFPTEWNIVNE